MEFYDAAVSVTIGSREFVGRERVFDALVSLLARMESGFGRPGVRSRRIRLLGESEEENGALVSLWQLEVEQCVEGSTCFE